MNCDQCVEIVCVTLEYFKIIILRIVITINNSINGSTNILLDKGIQKDYSIVHNKLPSKFLKNFRGFFKKNKIGKKR